MGEVYRGRDTELNRDVALKVMGERFAEDPDRLARFKREAQLLASLNHPHIASIYGVAEFSGGRALVLELVEGPTLADRIAAGPIPLEEALSIARQIALALEAAHAKGIVHRDLKPANVKVRPDGTVKVLDFGLAKALEPAEPTHSPTAAGSTMTQTGMILGTPAYMSPEQARGAPADKRSDIWAFGCVLYEMLAQRRTFQGETVTDTLELVLTGTARRGTGLPPQTPPAIRRLLRRCLQRDRSRRLADIADARLELDELDSEHSDDASRAAAGRARGGSTFARWLPWGIAAAAVAGVVWLAGGAGRESQVGAAPGVRSSILFEGRLGSATGTTLALSPDGRRLALLLTDSSSHRQLWLRDLDAAEARPLAGTDDATSPFWSPDGRWLAFVVNQKLKKIDPAAGEPVTVCDSALSGGAWSRDDVILFTLSPSQALAQVSAAGGTPSIVTDVDTRTEWRHAFPCFLPDGRHFVFAAMGFGDEVTSHLASLDSRERTRLPVDSPFMHAQEGCLLFAQGSTLMARALDPQSLALVGPAVPITERLRLPGGAGSFVSVYASASANGTLVFQEDPAPGFDLTWFDREGQATGTLGNAADYGDLTLSPDGRQALVSVVEPGTSNRDLWIFDVARNLRTRFTTDPAPETHCIWSPDGGSIVFDSQRAGHRDLYQKRTDGSAEELLLADEFDKNPLGWSPDGQHILYAKRRGAEVNVWVLPVGGDRQPFPFRETTCSFQLGGAFSPDGRWVSFFSNESGRMEVYAAPFPGPGPATQISTEGGWDSRWSRDGKEIFYRHPDGRLIVAAITASDQRLDVGEVKPLFMLPKVGRRYSYDVSPDGQRILAVTQKPGVGSEPLTLMQNWPALVRK
jgi:Tol biopolymer transport system component